MLRYFSLCVCACICEGCYVIVMLLLSLLSPRFIVTLFPGLWVARTYGAAQKECKDNCARRQEIPERPAKRSHRITAACSEPSAPSNLAAPAASNLPAPSVAASDDPSALGSDWVLLNTQTLTVHYCVSSQCVASGCGKYLLRSSQALRPSKLRGHGLFTCALCFGKRDAIPAHP